MIIYDSNHRQTAPSCAGNKINIGFEFGGGFFALLRMTKSAGMIQAGGFLEGDNNET